MDTEEKVLVGALAVFLVEGLVYLGLLAAAVAIGWHFIHKYW